MMEVNRVYTENCLRTMVRMPDGFVDLVVTSPPYDSLRDYKGFKFPFKHIARQLFRTMAHGGVVVWVVSDQTINGSESGTSFRQALFFQELGFRIHDTMIYQKHGVPLNHNRYEQDFEYMFIFTKGRPKTFHPIMVPCKYYMIDGDRTGEKWKAHTEQHKRVRSEQKRNSIREKKIKGNIWYYATGSHSATDDVAFKHPAIFPEQLAADHIKSWSNEKDLVYDPFAGSGTTLKMAHLLNRRWIGSEMAAEYCAIIEKRMAPYIQQKSLFY